MPKDPSREAHFPAIEKRYGEKMSYWFKVMKEVEGEKYPVQIAHLKENYGFSQAHANALVMYSRGSTSSKRFETPTEFFKTVSPQQAKTMKAIFKAITSKYPQLELVVAWNQPRSPPAAPDPVSVDFSLAMAAKSPPTAPDRSRAERPACLPQTRPCDRRGSTGRSTAGR